MVAQETGVAFSVDAETFMAFARSLPNGIPSVGGDPLRVDDLIDFVVARALDQIGVDNTLMPRWGQP